MSCRKFFSKLIGQKPTKYEGSSLVFENPFLNQALGSPNGSSPNMQNFLETSKIKTPQNHRLLKVARVKNETSEEREQEKTPDAKNRLSFSQTKSKNSRPSFNSSLEYIHKLRAATPSNSESHFGHSLALIRQEDLDKLHISQSSTLSKSATPLHFSQEKTKEIPVLERFIPPNLIEFSTLSDGNKKLFFAQLYNTQKQTHIKYASQKKLKSMAWKNYEAVRTREDFKHLYILIIDLNKFDHVRHQLSSSIDPQNILEIYGNFKTQSNSNLILFMMYYETQFEEKNEIFNRIIVDEKDENEFDTLVWRNIYRYQLHQIVFANPTLYPKSDKFDDLKKAVEEIMKSKISIQQIIIPNLDKKGYILPILHHLQKLENNPLVIERNGHVYNFDIHSYIQEYSSQYNNLLKKSFRNSPPQETFLYRTSSEEKTSYVKIRPKSSNITRTPKNHFSIDHHSKEAISILNGDALNNTAEKNQVSAENQESPVQSGLGRFQTYLNHVVQGNSSKINKKGSQRSLKHGMMIEGTRIGMEDKTGLIQIRKSFTPKNSLISSSFVNFEKASKTKTPKN